MNRISRYIQISGFLIFALAAPASGQRFLPDDPIKVDPDNLPMKKPVRVELSLSYDTIENTFVLKDQGELLRAQNVNTLGAAH